MLLLIHFYWREMTALFHPVHKCIFLHGGRRWTGHTSPWESLNIWMPFFFFYLYVNSGVICLWVFLFVFLFLIMGSQGWGKQTSKQAKPTAKPTNQKKYHRHPPPPPPKENSVAEIKYLLMHTLLAGEGCTEAVSAFLHVAKWRIEAGHTAQWWKQKIMLQLFQY